MTDRQKARRLRARVIAFYLPQYHPVEVNDKYWGKGFTEWRNVVNARPLFRGHYQPKLPADLGFYDLRIPEVRDAQAELAMEAGVEGFCYWHYWFGNGKEVLEMPLDEVIKLKRPNFPFCIGWANHSWKTSTWEILNGQKDEFIFKQEYLGKEDNRKHFYRLLSAFKDDRYIKVDGKLLFIIYDIHAFPDFVEFKEQWNQLADKEGLPPFFFVSHTGTLGRTSVDVINGDIESLANDAVDAAFALGADGVDTVNLKIAEFKASGVFRKVVGTISRRLFKGVFVEKYDFKRIVENLLISSDMNENVFPEIVDGNDRSPRAGRRAIVYYNVTPENFYIGAKKVIDSVQGKDFEHRIVFLNSWNEWGEGMYMEPDLKYGKGFIKALRKALS